MGYRYKKNLLLPTILYADKYVQNGGIIHESKIFHLLLTSANLTVKFWEDCGIDTDLVAEVTGLTKKQISTMERVFLSTINYNLYLSSEDIEQWRAKHDTTPVDAATASVC